MLASRRNIQIAVAVALFAAGLLAGIFIGRAIPSSSRTERDRGIAAAKAGHADELERRQAGAARAEEGVAKIALGNITTIPFQELYSVLSSRPAAELAELVRQLDELPPSHENGVKVATFFKAWAHFDAKGALAAAGSFKTPQRRQSGIAAVLDGADSAAGETLAKAIKDLPADSLSPNSRRMFIGRAATKWSEIDAPAAAAFFDTLPAAAGRDMFGGTRTIAENWAASDPQAALAWAQKHDGEGDMSLATGGAIAGWWQKDPRAAEEYVAANASTSKGRQNVSILASRMLNADPKHAVDWVTHLPDGEARSSTESIMAQQWSMSDPKAAGEWAITLPQGERQRALETAVTGWARNDPNAAAQWIGTLSGPQRDEALGAYSQGAAIKDPAGALNWAASIADPALRDRSTERVVRVWMRSNPNEASAWVQQSAFSDDQKKRLLEATPRR